MAFNKFLEEIKMTIFGPLCNAVLTHVEKALEEGRTVYPREGEEFFDKIMLQAMQRLQNLQSPSEIEARIDELEGLATFLQADTKRALKEHNLHLYPEDTYPYKAEIEHRVLDLKIMLETVKPKEPIK